MTDGDIMLAPTEIYERSTPLQRAARTCHQFTHLMRRPATDLIGVFNLQDITESSELLPRRDRELRVIRWQSLPQSHRYHCIAPVELLTTVT